MKKRKKGAYLHESRGHAGNCNGFERVGILKSTINVSVNSEADGIYRRHSRQWWTDSPIHCAKLQIKPNVVVVILSVIRCIESREKVKKRVCLPLPLELSTVYIETFLCILNPSWDLAFEFGLWRYLEGNQLKFLPHLKNNANDLSYWLTVWNVRKFNLTVFQQKFSEINYLLKNWFHEILRVERIFFHTAWF